MAKIIIIEPDISQDENEENLRGVIELLKEIAEETQGEKEV